MTEKTGFVYRDSDHSYFLNGKRMTGCTTILGVLAKPMLIPWAARMATQYIKENCEIEPEHGRYMASVDDLAEAEKAHTKKKEDGQTKGTNTHSLVEEYVKTCIQNNNGNPIIPNESHDSSIVPFIEWSMREGVRFISSEEKFYSEKLFVAGTADLVFEKDGKRFLGDIKTYKKIWDRVPFFQCSGYALMAEEMGKPTFDGYCIINLPKERKFDEAQDIKWSFDTEGDTKAFLACVELYRQLKNF